MYVEELFFLDCHALNRAHISTNSNTSLKIQPLSLTNSTSISLHSTSLANFPPYLRAQPLVEYV
ncbi:MAG: hypothetical protein K9G11_00240 [Rickettsiaceae bacterium]|nr:hypothetical protein [Rickettsiaceae bacterium]